MTVASITLTFTWEFGFYAILSGWIILLGSALRVIVKTDPDWEKDRVAGLRCADVIRLIGYAVAFYAGVVLVS